MEGPDDAQMFDQTQVGIQDSDEYSQLDLLAKVKLNDLEHRHRDELLTIADYLVNAGDPIDALLLFEITGYRADSVQDWNQYEQQDNQYDSEDLQETGRSKIQVSEQDESSSELLTKQ